MCPGKRAAHDGMFHFEQSLTQVTNITDGAATVRIIDPTYVPVASHLLCHQFEVEDGCGMYWFGTVDTEGECFSEIEVNCRQYD